MKNSTDKILQELEEEQIRRATLTKEDLQKSYLELEKENYGKIVYLSHDGGDGHGHYLADNFKELLNNWSKVGCVGGDDWQWEPFYTEGKGIDPECENAKLWREYIFNNIRK